MDISDQPNAAAMGKDPDDKCEVVGQDSFASPTGCRLALSFVCVKYCGRLQQP